MKKTTTKRKRKGTDKSTRYPSGSFRGQREGKIDYVGIIPPVVRQVYGEYMLEHCRLPDGGWRDMKNWQKGMSVEDAAESLDRHINSFLQNFYGTGQGDYEDIYEDMRDDLCGALFNAILLMFELCKAAGKPQGSGATVNGFSAEGSLARRRPGVPQPLERPKDYPRKTHGIDIYFAGNTLGRPSGFARIRQRLMKLYEKE